jgi:hypothetical protein
VEVAKNLEEIPPCLIIVKNWGGDTAILVGATTLPTRCFLKALSDMTG